MILFLNLPFPMIHGMDKMSFEFRWAYGVDGEGSRR
jgi:hypothetical protein